MNHGWWLVGMLVSGASAPSKGAVHFSVEENGAPNAALAAHLKAALTASGYEPRPAPARYDEPWERGVLDAPTPAAFPALDRKDLEQSLAACRVRIPRWKEQAMQGQAIRCGYRVSAVLHQRALERDHVVAQFRAEYDHAHVPSTTLTGIWTGSGLQHVTARGVATPELLAQLLTQLEALPRAKSSKLELPALPPNRTPNERLLWGGDLDSELLVPPPPGCLHLASLVSFLPSELPLTATLAESAMWSGSKSSTPVIGGMTCTLSGQGAGTKQASIHMACATAAGPAAQVDVPAEDLAAPGAIARVGSALMAGLHQWTCKQP